ncbi:RDD family protein [Flavobacterium ustbae]|uniref:RDD family protein n=1 Tax=Flavobacterium ustbae TaxID=2488790 RepID=UPI000F7AF696|nr:RDD family protein [Flavobacterium ustbae]
MKKINYLTKRALSAMVDLLFFALIMKALEPLIQYRNLDGKTYTHTGVFFLVFYIVFIVQDILFNKTIGKYLFKFEIKFENHNVIKKRKKYFKLIIRRTFDIIELVCPFIYILFIVFTKKNQKLGDLISGIVILEKTDQTNLQ